MAKYPANKISITPFLLWCKEAYDDAWGYIMGSYCQKPSELSSWYFTGQYSGSQETKALYWKRNAPKVTDCNGLVEGYLTKALGYKVNERARNNYWSWCSIKGKIKALQKTAGVAVFMANPGTDTMHHVGYLLCPIDKNKPNGDWWVIESRGVMYGVQKNKLSSRPWTHWGLMNKFFIYDCTPEDAYGLVHGTTVNTNPIVAKIGDKKSAKVKEIQEMLKKLGYTEVGVSDGDFGRLTQTAVKNFQSKNKISITGVVDTVTYNKLISLISGTKLSSIVVVGDRVNVRFEPDANSSILKVTSKNETFEEGTLKDDNWYNILVNNSNYWISKKFSKEQVM